MKINNIKVSNQGYVICKSSFYLSHNVLNGKEFEFKNGINILKGDIDDDNWGISYILPMYSIEAKKIFLFNPPKLKVNDIEMSFYDFNEYSCYMDRIYPLFKSKKSVRTLVNKGIQKNKLNISEEDIRSLFNIDKERFDRSLNEIGNEVFKAMAAIGYSFGKQVYCFPWMSKMRFESFHLHLTDLLDTLAYLDKVVILPIDNYIVC